MEVFTIAQWKSKIRFCCDRFDNIYIWGPTHHWAYKNEWIIYVWHHNCLRLIVHIDNHLIPDLLYYKYIVPEISDKEYDIQIALGTISIHAHRRYNIAEKAFA